MAGGSPYCQEAFDAADTDRLRTAELLDYLRSRDDGPWAVLFDDTWDAFGKKSASKLAASLREYEVRPKQVRFEDGSAHHRYTREHFAEAWLRWLP